MTYPGQPMTRPTLVTPGGGGALPSVRHLVGRTLLLIVHAYDPNAIFEGDAKVNPEVTCDLYVLDGGPLAYGDSAKVGAPHTPATHQVQVPAFFQGVRLRGPGIATSAIGATAGTGRPVGVRVVQGDKARLLVGLGTTLDTRAAEAPALTDALLDLLMAHRGAGSVGKPAGTVNPFGEVWTPPVPVELNPAPVNGVGAYPGAPTTPQISYGPPATPAVPQLPIAPALPPPPSPAPLPRPMGWVSDAQWQAAWPMLSEGDRAAWAAQPRAV